MQLYAELLPSRSSPRRTSSFTRDVTLGILIPPPIFEKRLSTLDSRLSTLDKSTPKDTETRFQSHTKQHLHTMPRDLAALVKGDTNSEAAPEGIMFGAQATKDSETASKRNEVHPYTQTLTLRDVDSCVILEDLAFPPNERASRAKVSLSFSSRPPSSTPPPAISYLSPTLQHPGVTETAACVGLSLLALYPLGRKWDPKPFILRRTTRDAFPHCESDLLCMHVARNAIHMHYPTISLSGIVSPTRFTPIIQRMHTRAQQTAAPAFTSIPHRIRSQEN
jgi:hypothetical protein